MNLEIVTLSEWNQTEKDKCPMILFICELFKNDKSKLIYKTEIGPQKTNLWLNGGKSSAGDKLGDWEWHVHPIVIKMNNAGNSTQYSVH